jgi:hypothetical protein
MIKTLYKNSCNYSFDRGDNFSSFLKENEDITSEITNHLGLKLNLDEFISSEEIFEIFKQLPKGFPAAMFNEFDSSVGVMQLCFGKYRNIRINGTIYFPSEKEKEMFKDSGKICDKNGDVKLVLYDTFTGYCMIINNINLNWCPDK